MKNLFRRVSTCCRQYQIHVHSLSLSLSLRNTIVKSHLAKLQVLPPRGRRMKHGCHDMKSFAMISTPPKTRWGPKHPRKQKPLGSYLPRELTTLLIRSTGAKSSDAVVAGFAGETFRASQVKRQSIHLSSLPCVTHSLKILFTFRIHQKMDSATMMRFLYNQSLPPPLHHHCHRSPPRLWFPTYREALFCCGRSCRGTPSSLAMSWVTCWTHSSSPRR